MNRPGRLSLLASLFVGLCWGTSADLAYAQPTDDAPSEDEPASPTPDVIPGLSDTSPSLVPTLFAPVNVVEGNGIKVGEGTVLHTLVGLDAGYISNIFFEDDSNQVKGRAITRLIAQVGAGSLPSPRLRGGGVTQPGKFQYRADLRLTYDFYLTGDQNVQDQGGLGINATVRGIVAPQQPVSFLFLDTFERMIRPANFETSSGTNRDINRLALGLQWAPTGRSVKGLLRYENVIDMFEDDDQNFADRIQHTVGLTASWRFRPVSVLFLDSSIGYFAGLGGESQKVSSFPFVVQTGIQTLLTLRTTLVARIGYQNGFYNSGPSFSAIVGGLQFGYRYSPLGRVVAQYDYMHQDSINANFFRDHAIRLRFEHQVMPFLATVEPALLFRQYSGIQSIIPTAADTRDDVLLSVTAAARYNFRNSLAAVLQYRYTSVFSDYRYTLDGDTDDPSFQRHEVILGLRAAL